MREGRVKNGAVRRKEGREPCKGAGRREGERDGKRESWFRVERDEWMG